MWKEPVTAKPVVVERMTAMDEGRATPEPVPAEATGVPAEATGVPAEIGAVAGLGARVEWHREKLNDEGDSQDRCRSHQSRLCALACAPSSDARLWLAMPATLGAGSAPTGLTMHRPQVP
jgi:hypothetical protein